MTLFDITKYVVLIPIALFSLTGVFVLFKYKNDKKNHFLIFISAVLLELLGYLLTVTSDSTGGALVSMRVFYLGIGILAPSVLFFSADYCEVKIRAALKVLLYLPALVYVIGAWTTNSTGLLYASFHYDAALTHYLVYEPGALFQIFQVLPSLYLAGALAMLIVLLLKQRSVPGRFGYLLILISVSSVFLIDFGDRVFALAGSSAPFYFSPPFTYVVVSVFIMFCVVKLKMFDFGGASLSAIESMNTISEAVIMLDEQLHFVLANNAAYALLPWLSRLTPGDSVLESPDWPKELSAEAFEGVIFNASFTLTDVEARLYRAKAHLFDSNAKKHWSILIQDVTESELFMKQLEEAAYTDTLTGLYNRRHFTEIAAPFIERAKRMNLPYYVMIADLDFFKDINDTYGHLAGDAVLRNIAAIMKSAVRSYDILARWGGEEFIFLITDSDVPSVLALSERIRQNVENAECMYQGKALKITISFGIAQNNSDSGDDLTELILRADEALYSSKQNGRNRVTIWGE